MGLMCSRSQPQRLADQPFASAPCDTTDPRLSHETQPGLQRASPDGRPCHLTSSTTPGFAAILPQKSAQGPLHTHSRVGSCSVHGVGSSSNGTHIDASITDHESYFVARDRVVAIERALDFDYKCRSEASPLEQRVDTILHSLRHLDSVRIYDQAEPRHGHAGQLHPRFAGDHFLSNIDLINQTAIFDVASQMPKGAHLHIHFNACLPPKVLLDIAKDMDRMFITSDQALLSDREYESFDKCELQFSILSPERVSQTGDLFSPAYKPRSAMRFAEFLRRFGDNYTRATPDEWLLHKLVFNEEEAHGMLQTAAGAWEKFSVRTRMMKGLFNYETAYRRYTRLCLEDFVRDNITYAEIRPNFMTSNQLYHDDGSGPMDNSDIMHIIIDEVTKFLLQRSQQGLFFGGVKVIYCTPRSFNPENVQMALIECLEFKRRWPNWIAGFDLVGQEAEGRPLRDFVPHLLDFKRMCREEGLDIPFLFHCGETLDMGSSTDGNLVDALLLGSKRIGHGFALAKHPYIMQEMKSRGVCLELCPISNEILGLTPRVGGHAMYQLLANNIHCTVSSDNGALFRSSLSHDFYQVMIGKKDMGIYGWKQLALWSIEHACLEDEERARILQHWQIHWQDFLQWVVDKYGKETGEA